MSSETDILNMALLNIGVTKQVVDIDDATDDSQERVSGSLVFDTERDLAMRDFPWPWARKYKTLTLIDGSTDDPINNDWTFAYKYPTDCLALRRIVTELGQRETTLRTFKVGRDYEVQNTGTTTVTLSTAAGWTIADLISVTASVASFSASDVGRIVEVESGSSRVFITITTYTSTTVIKGNPDITVPSALRSTALTTWSTIWYHGRVIYTNEEDAEIEYTVSIPDESEFDAMFVSMLAWRLGLKLAPLSRMAGVVDLCTKGYELEKSKAERAALNEAQDDIPPEAEWIRER